ncbi:MAG: 16S rRNA (cytosine(1402)-N(4))-methyltransferase RsmH [Ruaniaceae bacterium]|nr:16S rRNA (cytosine(1402)-N(4))-methyltransferase RsmH [Ruaniaceae bacterium]
MKATADRHVPVLVQRCTELLGTAANGIVVDATLGMGGHSEALLRAYPHLTVVGIDRDLRALELAGERLGPFGKRFRAFHGTYDQISEAAEHADGVLMDLGVSSMQLDEAERGFSYSTDAPLDMRMDTSTGRSAAELLNTASAAELREILYRYGEEKFAPAIAARIVRQRELEPLSRTSELAEIVRASIPAPARRTGGNPAKRTFQAIRVAVNDELRILERAVPAALEVLAPGGRIVVMAYQSLEDRVVKRVLARATTSQTPHGLPVDLDTPDFTLLTRGAERADEAEIALNPRAASVRLRAAERRTR